MSHGRLVRATIVAVALGVASLAHAVSAGVMHDAIQRTAESLRTQVLGIVRDVDPSAQVTVRLVGSDGEISIPGTPFKTRRQSAGDANQPMFKEAIIHVALGGEATISGDVTALIREVASNSAIKTTIQTTRLSASYMEARRAATATPPRSWEAPLEKMIGVLAPLSERVTGIIEAASQYSPKSMATAGAALIGTGVLLFVGLLVMMLRSQRQMLVVLEKGFQHVASTVEQSGGRGGMAALPGQDRGMLQASQAVPALPGAAESSVGALAVDSLLALLSDCYWTEQDAYGLFLWRRVPVDKKMELIRRMPELGEYGAFLSGQAETDMGMEQDPTYLAPLPVWAVDMPTLTDLVRQTPTLLTRLSPMRLTALSLGLGERIALMEQARAAGQVEVFPRLEAIKSAPRALRRSLHIRIRNDADEIELLAMPNPDIALIEEVPSLGWLLRLSGEKIEEIFQAFPARDLASAWTAPEEVLEKLGAHVGAKKLELVRSTLTRVSPSRSSAAFRMIHRAVLDELRRPKEEPEAVVAEVASEASAEVSSEDSGEHAA